jgi:hypothetical protein
MDRRAQLLAWIEETKRLQRKLGVVVGALTVVAIALLIFSRTAGGFALFAVSLFAICAFWVTAAHNAAHRQKLAELEQMERHGGKGIQTAHRRWHH